jgi:hypothetical protein
MKKYIVLIIAVACLVGACGKKPNIVEIPETRENRAYPATSDQDSSALTR